MGRVVSCAGVGVGAAFDSPRLTALAVYLQSDWSVRARDERCLKWCNERA